jgi:CRP-like cAMP-binding protein
LEKKRLITIDRSILTAANLPTIERSVQQGQTVYVPDAPARFTYVVVEGALCRFRVLPGGRRRVSQFLFPGDGFGYGMVRYRRDTVQALTDAKVTSAAIVTLEAAAKSDERLSQLLFNAAARATALVEEQSIGLRGRTVTEQVALFLLEMDARISTRGEINLPMRRNHIADYFGLTFETVSRTLSAFHRAKIIEYRDNEKVHRRIFIRDKQRLRLLASNSGHRDIWKAPPRLEKKPKIVEANLAR